MTNAEHNVFLEENELVYDKRRLFSVLEKAKRIILNSIQLEYQGDFLKAAQLEGRTKAKFEAKIFISSELINGFDGLARELYKRFKLRSGISDNEILELFPRCTLVDGENYSCPNYSDCDLLYGFVTDLALHLVAVGSIICVSIDKSINTILPASEFEGHLSSESLYQIPFKYDWYSPSEISELSREDFGADALHFSFVRDCMPTLDKNSFVQCKGDRNKTAEDITGTSPSWRDAVKDMKGWTKPHTNTQFVQKVVTLVMDGQFPNASIATETVVNDIGRSAKGADYDRGKVLSSTDKGAMEAIYKPARKILKELEKEGFLPTYA